MARLADNLSRRLFPLLLWLSLTQATASAAEPGEALENSIGMRLVYVPAGAFTMGSPPDEPGRQEREHPHEVTISRGFYLGAYEVTQAEYLKVVGRNPSHFGARERKEDAPAAKTFERHPVDSVRWQDAVDFCEQLSAREAEKQAGRRYRLPTEAEWEYACRAGQQTIWGFGSDRRQLGEHAWRLTRDSELVTHPVGEKRANRWGLYDMHGNVWEWCHDWYGADYGRTSPAKDPQGPREAATRVIRGGCYLSIAAHTRSATRFHDPPQIGDEDVGFRVLLEAPK